MKKIVLGLLLLFAKVMVAYPQIQFGLDLGVNSIYGTGSKNEHFNLSHKWNYSPWNIGYFVSMIKAKNQFTIGYRGSALDGIYKVNQYDASNLLVDIYYEYIVNRYYFSYFHNWKNFKIGCNFSSFQIENLGYGYSTSNKGIGLHEFTLKTDFDAPRKWYFVPAFELGYDLKFKGKTRLTAILEIPLWRFSGYNIYYESTVNFGQPQSININPNFYAIFINLRIPVFTIGKNWKYFTDKPNLKKEHFDSTERPD